MPCSYLWFGAIPNKSSKWRELIPFIFFLSLEEYQLRVIERKHFHDISPDLIVLQSLETISRAPATTHLQNIKFWFYALFLPLCRGYFDVYYTAGLIQIIVRETQSTFFTSFSNCDLPTVGDNGNFWYFRNLMQHPAWLLGHWREFFNILTYLNCQYLIEYVLAGIYCYQVKEFQYRTWSIWVNGLSQIPPKNI